MENKKKAALVSNIKRTAIKSSRDGKQLNPKLESEDTLIEIKSKSSNKTKVGKPAKVNIEKLAQKPTSILKDSTVANTTSTKMTTEELPPMLESNSPFKSRSRPLVLRSPPDTPKVSATAIQSKTQITTPKLLPSENPTKAAAMKPLKHRVNTVPKKQTETPKQQLDTSNQQLPEMPKKTFTLDTPTDSPSPEGSPEAPLTPPMAASESPELDTHNNLQLLSQQQRQTMMPPRPDTPIPLSSPPCAPDPTMYNPNEDWQQRLRSSQLRQNARAATVAAAAGAAAVAAQVRRDALDAIARKQQQQKQPPPRIREATLPANDTPHLDQRRGIRNINLLSSALSIIREMDPAYLEKLCYAIHDQLSKAEPLD